MYLFKKIHKDECNKSKQNRCFKINRTFVKNISSQTKTVVIFLFENVDLIITLFASRLPFGSSILVS